MSEELADRHLGVAHAARRSEMALNEWLIRIERKVDAILIGTPDERVQRMGLPPCPQCGTSVTPVLVKKYCPTCPVCGASR